MEQLTANEVRDAITWKYGDKSTRISAMLNAFADLLEAREKAKPVMIVNHVSSAEHDLPIGMKLYTHPSPSNAEKRETMTPRELAKRIERGEKWKLADEPTPCQSRDAERLADAGARAVNDLDTLRPEVADAVSALDETTCMTNPGLKWYATIRAELLRLTRERDHARQMHADRDEDLQHEWLRAEKAEAELAAALKANRDCVDHFEQMQAELAALKARTQWQPIETAPRDGTWIYVCRAGQPHSGTKVKFSRDCGGCPESWWDGSGFYRNPTFTHWMPLPPPPKGED